MENYLIYLILAGILASLGIGTGIGTAIARAKRQLSGEPDPSPPTNTGPITPIHVITDQECKENRREISDSFVKSFDEVRLSLDKQTETINDLKNAVTKLEAKVDTMPLEVENVTMKAINKHESQMHGRPATSEYQKLNRIRGPK